ncbi:MAG: FtsQ-type POTRA domain-containing protein [Firmicutes bacterium]|nr:FtsQ-type POTRA domain-containing protein [Bacillota bacterium]
MANERKKKKRRKKHYFLKFLILVIVAGAAFGVAHLHYFDVTEISISGNHDITDQEVLDLAKIKMKKSIFDAHPFLIERQIEKNMFVENAKVKRKLPGRVVIKIKERTGMGQFIKGKEYVITDRDGKVLSIRKKESKVAFVQGVTVKEAEKGSTIKTSNDKAVALMLNLIDVNEKNDLFFKSVYIKGGIVNAHVYDRLVVNGRYSNVVSCIKAGILKSVVYDLYQKGTEEGTINVSTDNYCFFTPKK